MAKSRIPRGLMLNRGAGSSLKASALMHDLRESEASDATEGSTSTVTSIVVGGITSIALAFNVPSWLAAAILNSPLVANGTITVNVTANDQPANTALRGPTSGADDEPAFRLDVNADLPARSRIQSLTVPIVAGEVDFDASLSSDFDFVITEDVLLKNPTNAIDGQFIVIMVWQPSFGGYEVTYDTKYRFGAEITQTIAENISFNNNARSYIGLRYVADDDVFDVIAFKTDYIT